MNYQKYANTYKNGEIISKEDENGITRDYIIQEVEELIDKLSEDKDENGKVKDPESLNNAVKVLMQLYRKYGIMQSYRKYGNPHEKSILEAIKKAQEGKTLEAQKQEALQELDAQLSANNTESPVLDATDGTRVDGDKGPVEVKDPETMYNEEYVDFEEVKEDETKENVEQTASTN